MLDEVTAFLVALFETGESKFPDDKYAFGRAVDSLPDNKLAERFGVCTSIIGKYSPDYEYGITLAQSATLLYRVSPEFTHIQLEFNPRTCAALKRRCPEYLEDAKELVTRYLEELRPHRPEATYSE